MYILYVWANEVCCTSHVSSGLPVASENRGPVTSFMNVRCIFPLTTVGANCHSGSWRSFFVIIESRSMGNTFSIGWGSHRSRFNIFVSFSSPLSCLYTLVNSNFLNLRNSLAACLSPRFILSFIPYLNNASSSDIPPGQVFWRKSPPRIIDNPPKGVSS